MQQITRKSCLKTRRHRYRSSPVVHCSSSIYSWGTQRLESEHSRSDRTNTCTRNACHIMNVESASRIGSLVDYINDGTFTLQEVQAISEGFVALLYHSPTDSTSTAAMCEVHYCSVCPDRAHTISKCPQISKLETFIRVPSTKVHSQPSRRIKDGRNGHLPMGPRRKRM